MVLILDYYWPLLIGLVHLVFSQEHGLLMQESIRHSILQKSLSYVSTLVYSELGDISIFSQIITAINEGMLFLGYIAPCFKDFADACALTSIIAEHIDEAEVIFLLSKSS